MLVSLVAAVAANAAERDLGMSMDCILSASEALWELKVFRIDTLTRSFGHTAVETIASRHIANP